MRKSPFGDARIKIRWNAWTILALVGVQIIYGLGVFLATRHYYMGEPTLTAASVTNRQEMPRDVHQGLSGDPSVSDAPLLPGSGRITVQDAQRLVTAKPPADSGTSAIGYGENPQQLSRTADELFRQRRFQEAAAHYTRALEQAPYNVDVYNNLGLTLHYIGRSAEALDVLNKGIAVDSSYPRIWLTLGFVQQSVGDLNGARVALTRAAELDPKSAIGHEAKRMLAALPE